MVFGLRAEEWQGTCYALSGIEGDFDELDGVYVCSGECCYQVCFVLCCVMLCCIVSVCVRELGGVLVCVSWRFVVYERNECHLIRF